MSILDSLGRRRHLDDTALTELWCSRVAAGTGSPASLDPISDEGLLTDAAHVDACGPCRARYDSLADWLADTRTDAIAEADDVFPSERLATQQAQILRRLETLERPARVIAFPRHSQPMTVPRRGPQRWIAAGLAAGLIVGLGAGELLDFRRSMHVAAAPAGRLTGQDLASIGQTARGVLQPVSLSSDDMFLYDSEAVSTSPRVEALQALDALTPRVRDVDQAR